MKPYIQVYSWMCIGNYTQKKVNKYLDIDHLMTCINLFISQPGINYYNIEPDNINEIYPVLKLDNEDLLPSLENKDKSKKCLMWQKID